MTGVSLVSCYALCAFALAPSRVAALVAVDFAPAIDPRGQMRVAAAVGTQPDHYANLDACNEALTGRPAASAAAAVRSRYGPYTPAV